MSGREVRARYATFDGTASSPSDYQALYGTLTIPPGEQIAVVPFDVVGDLFREPIEVFWFVLGSPENAVLGRYLVPGVLLNDDP